MTRYMQQTDKEYVKIAMLKQGEIFRYQVHELHRLYRIQQQLMGDMKIAEMKRQKGRTRADTELLDAEDETGPRRILDAGVVLDAAEESDLELTLATGSGGARRKKKDASLTSDSAASFSSSSNEYGNMNMKRNRNEWVLHQVADESTRFGCDGKSRFDSEEQMRKDGMKQPHWLFPRSKRDMLVSFGL
ncbi:hypothetical protein MUK42_31479 [Musa troglodytarum]|uniref:Uncharacterized protein n=1 Tax=Musa troglodytarum TaxID=320322 RepID=A0A9E7JXX6_9LILI|nr:hypothetical protein MUK42_31479 [Musa troglodytarum]URD96391.1 hypothetical protein MUK42_31479 [Musa troglodytarum]